MLKCVSITLQDSWWTDASMLAILCTRLHAVAWILFSLQNSNSNKLKHVLKHQTVIFEKDCYKKQQLKKCPLFNKPSVLFRSELRLPADLIAGAWPGFSLSFCRFQCLFVHLIAFSQVNDLLRPLVVVALLLPRVSSAPPVSPVCLGTNGIFLFFFLLKGSC